MLGVAAAPAGRLGGAFLALAFAACACASASAAPEAEDAGAAVVDAGPPDPLVGIRALWDDRLHPASLDLAIAQLEVLTSAPAWQLAAEAHLFRATAFRLRVRPLDREGARADLERARALAILAWGSSEAGVAAFTPATLGDTLDRARPAAAPALLALARADWELAPLADDAAKGMALRRECRQVAARAAGLAPDLERGSPRRLWARTLAVLPAPTGGDFGRARFEFEEAIAAFPESIANRVEEAQRYAVKANDRSMFRALLRSALRLDPAGAGERAPEEHLARLRALWLLHHERQLFGR